MLVIYLYRDQQTWVFDDEAVGLVREPFVSGVPEMIDQFVQDIPSAKSGFRLLFSASPFPGYQAKLIELREEYDGNWYCWHQIQKRRLAVSSIIQILEFSTPKNLL